MQPEIAWRAILSHAERASEPEARARCWQLLKEMAIRDYEQWGEGYIGISMGQQWSGQVTNDSAPRFGMIVTAIVAGSPAAEAKLAVGDIIVGLNELTWRKPDIILDEKTGLSAKIRAVGAGQKVVCIVWRKGQLLSFEIRLSRRPKQIDQWRIQAQQNGQWRLDASEWQKLADEEKGSKEYFDEWLRVKKASIAH